MSQRNTSVSTVFFHDTILLKKSKKKEASQHDNINTWKRDRCLHFKSSLMPHLGAGHRLYRLLLLLHVTLHRQIIYCYLHGR